MAKPKQVKIVKNPEGTPIAAEILEQAIVDIGDGMKRINQTRLTRKALVVLLANDTGLGKGTVETVLSALDQLERTYLRAR